MRSRLWAVEITVSISVESIQLRIDTPQITRVCQLPAITQRVDQFFLGFEIAIDRAGSDIRGARAEDVEVVAAVLARMNSRCRMEGDVLRVEQSNVQAAGRVTTSLWPGFPSDLVSLVTVLATQAQGRTLVHDWLYELRLFALEQLSGMGADLFLCDPHRIIVTGPRRLRGRPLDSRDLRSGMALIAAALAADGQSRLSPLETVERGYGRLVERLQELGAKVAKLP